jgi:hypothetical protein
MRITIPRTSFVAVFGFGAFIVDIVASQHIATNIGLVSDHAATAKTKTQEGEECSFVDPTLQTREENISSHIIVNCEESDTCVEDDTSSLGGRCLLNQDLVAAIQAAANNMKHGGGECVFNDNNKVVDSGILTHCRKTETCVKDLTSSLGGLCVNVDEAYADIWVERQLAGEETDNPTLAPTTLKPTTSSTECTFHNGTLGTKCDGSQACNNGENINITKIGCGSCIGEKSCYYMSPVITTVGEESCIGYRACSFGKSDDRAHNVCIQMKTTSTHNYLIKVEVKQQREVSGTIPAGATKLAISSLVSLVKLCNVCIVYRTTALSLSAKLCSCSTSSSNRE